MNIPDRISAIPESPNREDPFHVGRYLKDTFDVDVDIDSDGGLGISLDELEQTTRKLVVDVLDRVGYPPYLRKTLS